MFQEALGLSRKQFSDGLAKGETAIVDEFEGPGAREEDKASVRPSVHGTRYSNAGCPTPVSITAPSAIASPAAYPASRHPHQRDKRRRTAGPRTNAGIAEVRTCRKRGDVLHVVQPDVVC